MYICVQWAVSVTVSHFHHANIPHKFLIRAKCIGVCQLGWGLIVCSVDVFHTGHPLYTTRRLFVLLARSMWLPAHCPSPRTFDHIDGKTWPNKMKKTNTMKFEMTMAACPVVSTKDSVITPIIKFQFHWVKSIYGWPWSDFVKNYLDSSSSLVCCALAVADQVQFSSDPWGTIIG